jgi:3-methyl-2-oxobutanoate hydroxymethyltransferase
VHHLRDMKNHGEKWAMLTAYDQYTAEIFDQAGIPVLLVGDSAANNVFGYETTLRGHRRRAIPLARAVARCGRARARRRRPAVRFLPGVARAGLPHRGAVHEGAGVHAVKLEGRPHMVPMVEQLTRSASP